ncbi:MAG: D-alanyl-D-alanine carboxypeptidase family protein [Saprospiraceae bacterium]|nr:MAG: D-alanyl-D-alanine carboxypeptidase family protein [Saprospiraceae bacterium]
MKHLLFLIFSTLMFSACTDVQGSQQQATGEQPTLDTPPPGAGESTPAGKQINLNEPPNSEFSPDYLMGKFDPAQHPDFVAVDSQYSDGDPYFLRKDTYAAFQKMWEAAKADGVKLTIISATRNFERQREIWEAKWTGARLIENGTNAAKKYPEPKTRALKILEYSSMPGTSRHHWGTDIDLNDLDNFTFEQGPGKPVYDWLKAHAHEFGFCQPYSKKGPDRPEGYNEEKWHWSYIPVARKLTDLAAREMKDEMIDGFKGAGTAAQIGVVKKYVLGVNKDCL